MDFGPRQIVIPGLSDSEAFHAWKLSTLIAFYRNKLLAKWRNEVKASSKISGPKRGTQNAKHLSLEVPDA